MQVERYTYIEKSSSDGKRAGCRLAVSNELPQQTQSLNSLFFTDTPFVAPETKACELKVAVG